MLEAGGACQSGRSDHPDRAVVYRRSISARARTLARGAGPGGFEYYRGDVGSISRQASSRGQGGAPDARRQRGRDLTRDER